MKFIKMIFLFVMAVLLSIVAQAATVIPICYREAHGKGYCFEGWTASTVERCFSSIEDCHAMANASPRVVPDKLSATKPVAVPVPSGESVPSSRVDDCSKADPNDVSSPCWRPHDQAARQAAKKMFAAKKVVTKKTAQPKKTKK
jgi:hypothetical protein